MEHVSPSSVTAALNIAKAAGEISKKLYEFGKGLKDRDEKHRVDEILDQLRELKQSASELQDENRELRERLRFKSDEYEFRSPFWYHKENPNQPLCAKCFATETAAPMGSERDNYRRCLVCDHPVMLRAESSSGFYEPPHRGGVVLSRQLK